MANNGLPKLYGVRFTRIQPELCGHCQFYRIVPEAGEWAQQCAAKGKYLSNPHAIAGHCKEFQEAGGLVESRAMIDEWIQSAKDHQAWKAKRKATGQG